MTNRIVYWIGLAMAVIMTVFTVFLILERISQIEAVRSGFWDNLAYTTSQADFEIVRLIDSLSQIESDVPEAKKSDVFIRYEVALSRLVGMTEGGTGERIMSNEAARDLILKSKSALENMEQAILDYGTLSPDQQQNVKSDLRAVSRDFHRATVTIASMRDRDQSEFYQDLARAARFEIFMLTLILLAGGVAFSNAFLERRRYIRLNQTLSDTVAERTSELQSSNTLLKSQIVERAQAEKRYRTLFEHATEAIVVFDVDANAFVEANPRAEQLFGASRKSILGRYGPGDFSPNFQPDGRLSNEASMRSAGGETLRRSHFCVSPLL